MIESNKNGLNELFSGKTIQRVETIETVLFKKDVDGDHGDETGERFAVDDYLTDSITIHFTDGSCYYMRIEHKRGCVHIGSGGANLITEVGDGMVPFISVKKE